METTLINILKSIVKNPDDIKVEREDIDEIKVQFNINCNEEDKGILIGKKGRTIKALNTIISIKGIKENKKPFLKIN